jgi:hypothetical protein
MLLLEQWSPPETTKSRKPRYFRSLDDWRAVMVPLIQANDSPGDPVTQERVAPYLQEHLPKRSAKQAMRKDESVKKLIYRTGLKFGYTWDDLVREARSQLLPE